MELFTKTPQKLTRSISMHINDESRIFHSTPKRFRLPKRKLSTKLSGESLKRCKSKISIDSDWSVVTDASSEISTSSNFRRSNISLQSLREKSLSRISASKLKMEKMGSKLKQAKKTLSSKFKRNLSKTGTKIKETLPQCEKLEQPNFTCTTIQNHIILNTDQEYVEEYDLVIWEEKFVEKEKPFIQRLKKFKNV